ncbi:glycosyltransferase [Holophaga foetida]|uniref:glycosyltransferase n=1 Tax=Holophaga foetida TaxID=35839 RepID=UPI000247377B|nr:glycosyltransferase [Holophaga foetida]
MSISHNTSKASLTSRLSREWQRFTRRLGLQQRPSIRPYKPEGLISDELSALLVHTPPAHENLARLFTSKPEENPIVSVVIPAFNRAESTTRTLLALAILPDRTPREIILVDDHSSDETQQRFQHLPGIRYARNPVNKGFGHSCNAGAELARGKVLWFLNNDTLPLPGSLDSLVEAWQSDQSAGMVGSKLLFPSGEIQEAGSTLRSDGHAGNLGRGNSHFHPTYSYRTLPAYCSAASLLVPRDLFIELGGFDRRYSPAYYEDTDLAMQVQRLGLKVIYQPASQVIHEGGGTCGRDTSSGVKAHQILNQIKFRSKWDRILNRSFPSDFRGETSDRRTRPEALVIDSQLPKPDQDSGSIDMFNTLKILVDLGYNVTFTDTRQRFDPHYTRVMQKLGIHCLYANDDQTIGSHLKTHSSTISLVFLARPEVADEWMDRIRKAVPAAKIIYDTVDLHHLRLERQARLDGSRKTLRSANHFRKLEFKIMRKADATLVRSTTEQSLLETSVNGVPATLFPLTREIPPLDIRDASKRSGLLFIGGFRHTPNVDAIAYFISSVWPRVLRERPETTLTIVGSNTPPKIQQLASPSVHVLGYVADLALPYREARVAIAPLRYGAGLKGKVAEAMLFGVPCVTTPIGAEGMPAKHGKEIMIAREPEEMAHQILSLLSDDDLWREISNNGRHLATQLFSRESNTLRMANLLADLGLPPLSASCPLCSYQGTFAPLASPDWSREPKCPRCGASPNLRIAAKAILDECFPGEDFLGNAFSSAQMEETISSVGIPDSVREQHYPWCRPHPAHTPHRAIIFHDPDGANDLDVAELACIADSLSNKGCLALVIPYDPWSPTTTKSREGTRHGRDFLQRLHKAGLDGECLWLPRVELGALAPMTWLAWPQPSLHHD